jgi:hypothetical protein
MPNVTIDIQVWCSCGKGLCNQSTEKQGRFGPGIEVEPCETCMSKEYDRGVDDGYEKRAQE